VITMRPVSLFSNTTYAASRTMCHGRPCVRAEV